MLSIVRVNNAQLKGDCVEVENFNAQGFAGPGVVNDQFADLLRHLLEHGYELILIVPMVNDRGESANHYPDLQTVEIIEANLKKMAVSG